MKERVKTTLEKLKTTRKTPSKERPPDMHSSKKRTSNPKNNK
jgi:hypothetical protein